MNIRCTHTQLHIHANTHHTYSSELFKYQSILVLQSLTLKW